MKRKIEIEKPSTMRKTKGWMEDGWMDVTG